MNTLIEDISKGNIRAFKQLFDDFYPALCVFAHQYVADREVCKDIAQEVLLNYWERRSNFENIYKLKGFLYTATRNRSLNHLKHEHFTDDSSSSLSDEIAEEAERIEEEIMRQETYRMVRKAVNELPAQMCRIVKLSMQGKKNSEIALELGIAEGTVHALKKSAYKKLREKLKGEFYLIFLLPVFHC